MSNAELGFDGKVAIITGAGGGLGRQHALMMAARGALIVVNDLGGAVDGSGSDKGAAQLVVDEIVAAGGEAVANTDSVATPDGGEAIVQSAVDAFGTVDIVINNAGILRDKSFAKVSLEDFRVVVDVHLMGSVMVTKEVWPIMREQGYGRIVMTTSPSGLYGNFGQTNYGAAKLGIVGFMNTLKIEGAKNNIHTNSVAPVALTRMTEGLIPDGAAKELGPELITPGVIYLCSEQAPNGVVLQAAGGNFSMAAIVENQGVNLGLEASADDVADAWAKISDLTGAKPRNMLQLGG